MRYLAERLRAEQSPLASSTLIAGGVVNAESLTAVTTQTIERCCRGLPIPRSSRFSQMRSTVNSEAIETVSTPALRLPAVNATGPWTRKLGRS